MKLQLYMHFYKTWYRLTCIISIWTLLRDGRKMLETKLGVLYRLGRTGGRSAGLAAEGIPFLPWSRAACRWSPGSEVLLLLLLPLLPAGITNQFSWRCPTGSPWNNHIANIFKYMKYIQKNYLEGVSLLYPNWNMNWGS